MQATEALRELRAVLIEKAVKHVHETGDAGLAGPYVRMTPGHDYGRDWPIAAAVETVLAELVERGMLRPEPESAPRADRDKLAEAFAEYLGDEAYWCYRDYSGWAHGTMGLDDFRLARDNDDIIESLVDIAVGKE